MGSVDTEVEAADRRAELLDWLNELLPDFDVPIDSSEEELRKQLYDGTVLCSVLNVLIPSIAKGTHGAYDSSEPQVVTLKKFLSVIEELGLPGFEITDIEQGSMTSVVNCLLSLKNNITSEPGEDGSFENTSKIGSGSLLNKKWRAPAPEPGKHAQGQLHGSSSPGEEKRKGHSEAKSHHTSRGQKFREVFQLKKGSYSDLPAAKISEMMHSNSLDNATTQSLLSVVNGILDESIERKKGEIPHRVVYLLRKVVQEIERRISTQAEHIRNQNTVVKAREEKYRSRIKALETLVNGTNEENQIVMNRLHVVKAEKSKFEEKTKNSEQDIARLMKEKENAEKLITKLKKEMDSEKKLHEDQRKQLETKAKELETSLTGRIRELEFLLGNSRKRVGDLETASELKLQIWNRRENIYQRFVDNQLYSAKNLRMSSDSLKQEVFNIQEKWRDEISDFGLRLKGLVDAAENYHRVLAENQRLFNEVQELKGNIRVYCRIRPFLPGQSSKSTTIDYIGENGELLITNPVKQGKDGHRMFKFNKVFAPASSQLEVFADIQPLIRSVLDGFNVCIFAYGQTGSGKTYTMSGPGTSKEDWGVNYRALNDLFNISLGRRNAFLYEVGVQMVEIYNEQVRDLLSNDVPNGLVVPEASLHAVNSTTDVLDLMQIGQSNRAVGSTALNERSSRSHSILTVHVKGMDVKNGSTSRGCLHLIDLAGSERVERSEATGDRLKEAQHINKSLSALGDVIFALAQKNAHVPYRNSKLTQVLQSSLGGQAKTLMFVQINPDVESYAETISTLKFAERVSGVELGAARSNKEGKDIKELLEQVSSLKDTIARKDNEIEQLQTLKELKSRSTNSNSTLLRHSSTPTYTAMAISSHGEGLDEGEDEESEGSEGGFSVGGETDCSLGSGFEFVPKPGEPGSERQRNGHKISRSVPRSGTSRLKIKDSLNSPAPGLLKTTTGQTTTSSSKASGKRWQ
ncbi:Kinesin KP1 [Carex littledalei]|uniref:Kinesin KP1 n=1 Tax=Carex littledalei TaxID=544730 RepID=A0A833RFE7_9POAL|nr:Kinesin KP1 [Carex littledalei]